MFFFLQYFKVLDIEIQILHQILIVHLLPDILDKIPDFQEIPQNGAQFQGIDTVFLQAEQISGRSVRINELVVQCQC